jgi:hypothetical protein
MRFLLNLFKVENKDLILPKHNRRLTNPYFGLDFKEKDIVYCTDNYFCTVKEIERNSGQDQPLWFVNVEAGDNNFYVYRLSAEKLWPLSSIAYMNNISQRLLLKIVKQHKLKEHKNV